VHDPSLMMFLALIALGGFGASLAAVIVRYQHRLLRCQGMVSPAAQLRGGVRWQVGRWDSDPRHVYVANLGDDIAYEVEVAEDQKVLATAPSVPPYSASPLRSIRDQPCYLNACIRGTLMPRAAASVGRVREEHSASPSEDGVVLQVSWRTGLGERCTGSICADLVPLHQRLATRQLFLA
jgi:hypothetical protein